MYSAEKGMAYCAQVLAFDHRQGNESHAFIFISLMGAQPGTIVDNHFVTQFYQAARDFIHRSLETSISRRKCFDPDHCYSHKLSSRISLSKTEFEPRVSKMLYKTKGVFRKLRVSGCAPSLAAHSLKRRIFVRLHGSHGWPILLADPAPSRVRKPRSCDALQF